MTGRRILVFGGSGQVGTALAALALPDDAALVAPPRSEADITDRRRVEALLDSGTWSAVLNLAAWTAVDAAEKAVGEAFAANALGPAILADATRERNLPLIHVSTDYVFDGSKPTPYVEGDATRPIAVYGASKLAGEDAVRTGNPCHLIVRTSWVYGGSGRNFLRTMLKLAESRDAVRVVDDQWGTPTAAPDLAEALLALALRDDLCAHRGVFHYANRGETTWCGLARRIFALSAARGGPSARVEPIVTADFPTPARRPANSRLDTSRIESELGIVPRQWDEALERVMA